jgi:uncharacterized membrane protein YccC
MTDTEAQAHSTAVMALQRQLEAASRMRDAQDALTTATSELAMAEKELKEALARCRELADTNLKRLTP